MLFWFGWLLFLVLTRIYPRFLSVTTGAKTGHGVEDWVLGAVTLACHSFNFLVYFYL
jgi:hypothetical protein